MEDNNINIFEGAKFGDKFMTRDGNIAIYFSNSGNLKNCVLLCHNGIYEYDESGKDLYETYDLASDIVSRYQEQIDEKKLDEFAMNYIESKGCTDMLRRITAFNGFRAGYHKALEE